MKHKVGHLCIVALCAVTMQGCADFSGPATRPSPATPPNMDWDGSAVGSYNTIEEAQAALGAAKVHEAAVHGFWNDAEIEAWGHMKYRGTHAEIVLTVSGTGPKGSWGPAQGRRVKESGGLNALFTYEEGGRSPLRYNVGGTCGHLANVNGEFTAYIKVPIPIEAVIISEDPYNSHKPVSQGECPYTDETQPAPGGGGGCDGVSCEDEYPAPAYCVVRTWYYEDTREVIAQEVIYCSNW